MRRALVTGGSGDIGRAICQRLAADGLHVIVHAFRHPERATEVAAAIQAAGGSAETVTFDVADEEAVRRSLNACLETGPIQVVVNNAGLHDDVPLAGMSSARWHRVIGVCLHGFFNVTQPLLLPMIGARWGRIINISSLAGVTGNRGQTNYAAAKAGLHGATKALALELAKREITVNCVAPGLIETEMLPPEILDDAMKMIPLRRVGKPEDVAAAVAYLMSDEAGYVTRQVISVNGGML